MKLVKRYIPVFFGLSILGTFFLRWFAEMFLYNAPEKLFKGSGFTFATVFIFGAIISIIISSLLIRFEKITEKAGNGEEVSEAEKKKALGVYQQLNVYIVGTNVVGFIIGQIVVNILEVSTGQIEANWPRLIITFFQSTFLGFVLALLEIYVLNYLMMPFRRLLKIHSIDEFGTKKTLSIGAKIILASIASALFVGLNLFASSFYIVLNNGGTLENPVRSYILNGLQVFFVSAIPCLTLILVVVQDFKNRISNTSARLYDIGTHGDLHSRLNLSMNDDIGRLTSNLNVFLNQLSTLVSNLKEEILTVSKAAEVLSNSTNESKIALMLMSSSVKRMKREGDAQDKQIMSANTDIQGITKNAKDVEQHVIVQTAALQQSSASVNEMAANINSVAEMSSKAEKLAVSLRQSSVEGASSINSAVAAITEIQQASKQVQSIIQDIQKIASQTNLLSMNAAIEAAHAGEAGKGFAVVANEVGSLASSSSKSAKDIQQHIKTMVSKIEHGVNAITDAGTAFHEIDENVEQTSTLVETISNAMDEQRTGAEETLKATNSVVEAINSVKTLSVQQREYAENMEKAMGSIVESSKKISLALDENSTNSDSLDNAMHSVSMSVENNNVVVSKMREQIEIFKL